MADDYTFNVRANISSASDKLKQISDYMDAINSKADKGALNSNFLSGNSMNQAVDNMRQMSQLASELKQSLDSISQASFKSQDMQSAGWASQARSYLNSHLNEAQSSFNDISGMGQSINSGMRYHYKWNEAMHDSLDNNQTYQDSMEYQTQRSYMRRLNSRQLHRSQAATASGHMTAEARDVFYQDNEQGLNNLRNYQTSNTDKIHAAQARMQKSQSRIESARQNMNISDDDRNKITAQHQQQIDENEKLIENLKKFNQELDQNTQNLGKYQQNLENSNPSVTPERGTIGRYFHDRANSIAYHTVGAATQALSQQEAAGQQLNSSTDDQAINLSYTSGLSNDQAVRDTLFNVNQKRSNGYDLQTSMDYYQMSLLRNGYNGGNNSQSTSMVNAMEQGGNDTGIGRQAYQSLMGTIYNSGAISNTSDVNAVNNDVTGLNVYARTTGMQQQQARTFQNLTNQIGQQQTISRLGVDRIAASEAGFARYGGRSLQGEQGERALSQFQGGMVAGGEGKNSQLLQLMVQSNPQKYGGLSGMERAEEDMSKGLSSQSNINLARNLVRQSGGSRQGALMLQHMYGVSNPREARSIAKVLESNMSSSQQNRRIQQIRRDGSNRRRRNQRKYNSSDTATRNQHTAEKQRQGSQTDAAYQRTIGRAANVVGQLPTWMTTLITITTSILQTLMVQAGAGMLSHGISSASEGSLRSDTSHFEDDSTLSGRASKWLHSGRTGRAMDWAHERTTSARDWMRSGRTGRILNSARDKASSASDWLHSGRTGRIIDSVRSTGRHSSSRSGLFSRIFRHGSRSTEGATRDASHLGKFGRFAGGAGRMLGRANDVALVATSALQVGHDLGTKHPVRNTINDAGGLAGGLGGAEAGATAGAALGSVVPGIGTVIGGIGGGLIGGVAGSGIGEWATKKVTGLFSGNHSKHKERARGKHSGNLHDQQSSQNNNSAYEVVHQEEINIRHQRENYEYFERLLDKESTLLKNEKSSSSNLFNKNGSSAVTKNNKSKKAKNNKSKTAKNNKSKTTKVSKKQAKNNKETKESTDKSKSATNTKNSFLKAAQAAWGHHANGGITGNEQLSWLSEGNSKEAVVPLDADKRNNPESKSLATTVASAYNLLNVGRNSISSSKSNNTSFSPNYSINVNVNGDVNNGQQKGAEIANAIKESMANGINNNSSNYQVLNGGQAN